jgi:hypothetical protein
MSAGSVIEDNQIVLARSRLFEPDDNFTAGPATKCVA